jgi:peptide deformylase
VTDRPSSLELQGQPADVHDFMPLVLINPEIQPVGNPIAGPEGCLSFPEIFAEITRPDVVDVKASDEEGKPIQFRCGGLLARAVQHETDHLHGILFIDRMTKEAKEELKPELEIMRVATKAALGK